MAQELGSIPIDCESVHQPRTGEQGVVASRDDTRHNYGVDEATCRIAPSLCEDYCERTGRGRFLRQVWVVPWNIQPNEQDTEDVEKENPPEHIAHNFRQGFGRILRLSGSHSNALSAPVRERRRNKHRREASNVIMEWSTGYMPVVAANVFVVPVAAAVDDDAEDDENADGDDFEQTQPVLNLSNMSTKPDSMEVFARTSAHLAVDSHG